MKFLVYVFCCALLLSRLIRAKRKYSHSPFESVSQPLSVKGERSCTDGKDCDCSVSCLWPVPNNARLSYSLIELCNREYNSKLQTPHGASLKISLCGEIHCGKNCFAKGCITVPGVKPTSTGRTSTVKSLVDGVPSSGFELLFDEGETCEVTGKPRRTTVSLPCDPRNTDLDPDGFKPGKAREGERTEICHYYIMFPPSQFGCPLFKQHESLITDYLYHVIVWAVSGCIDSAPPKTTVNCFSNGGQTLTLHGMGFSHLCLNPPAREGGQRSQLEVDNQSCTEHIKKNYCVLVGPNRCTGLSLSSAFTMTCVLNAGQGEKLSVTIVKKTTREGKDKGFDAKDVIAEFPEAVSYKQIINYRQKFDQFVEYGVGGLKKEIDQLYRRAFASRGELIDRELGTSSDLSCRLKKVFSTSIVQTRSIDLMEYLKYTRHVYEREVYRKYSLANLIQSTIGASSEVLSQLGVTHIKGILLYGPPGNGKTLLARTIAKILGSSQVQLINGPEIISKYLGESERNLRGYFDLPYNAYKKYGDASELYVIIIDEVDAICKPRGKSDQSAAGVAYDSLVNQLLTLMDGLSEISNVLVIGMTNRKELMDPALLRPGRFEVQIELELPDEEGRLEIFEIHTHLMRESGSLGKDVSLPELVTNTTGYSGAEIAGCVRAAASYALERHQFSNVAEALNPITVTAEDFRRALKAISPAHTHSESLISSLYLPPNFLSLGTQHENIITSLLDIVHSLKHNPYNKMQTVLIYGPKGTGKTSLAARIAVLGQFKFVKILTASSIVGLPEMQKVEIIRQAFTDAMKMETSLVVLDDLHRLLEYIQIGSQVLLSHSIMHVISTMLSVAPSTASSVLVIGTMTAESKADLIQPSWLGLHHLFSWHYMLLPMDSSAVTVFLNSLQIARLDGSKLILPSGVYSIAVRDLVQGLECACTDCSLHRLQRIDQQRFNNCIMALMSNRRQAVRDMFSE